MFAMLRLEVEHQELWGDLEWQKCILPLFSKRIGVIRLASLAKCRVTQISVSDKIPNASALNTNR